MSKLVETLKEWQANSKGNIVDVLEVTILTIERLEKLKTITDPRLAKLDALEAYGVDNWEGYGDAMASLDGDEDNE